jgi:hypothetical protein
MSGEGTIVRTEEKSLYCLPCRMYYKPEFMGKYPCICCGNRFCLAKHAKDNNLTCEVCREEGLCEDCCIFAMCCGHKSEFQRDHMATFNSDVLNVVKQDLITTVNGYTTIG